MLSTSEIILPKPGNTTRWIVWARSTGNSCAVITVSQVSFYPDGHQEKCETGLIGIRVICARKNDSSFSLPNLLPYYANHEMRHCQRLGMLVQPCPMARIDRAQSTLKVDNKGQTCDSPSTGEAHVIPFWRPLHDISDFFRMVDWWSSHIETLSCQLYHISIDNCDACRVVFVVSRFFNRPHTGIH